MSEEYSYDRNNRLLTLTNKKPDRSVISSYSYTYDLAGRQTGKTDSFGTSSYTYDAAGRVTRAETPGKTSIYAFDRSGNRISMNETYASLQTTGFIDELSNRAVQYKVKKSQYVYTDTNRLVKLVEEMYDESSAKVLTKTVQYVYDSNGNQVSEYASYVHPSDLKLRRTIKASVYGDGQPSNPDPLIDRTLNTYDGFNRLKKVERMEAGVRTLAEYVYNGDDLRVRKTVKKSDSAYTPEVTSFLYDRQHVILEMDDSGNVTARYVRGINYIAKVAGGDETYFLYNGHGDVVQTVTAAGEVRNEYDYDIFGNPMLTIETAACSIRYAGEYLDNETGLYYLRARYYDPNIGRFISEDSYWGEDDNPLSLNLYTYAFNDPIRFIDPTGHNAEKIDKIIKEIDKQKSIWWAEENGAGKGQAKWTAEQTKAHNKADKLREELEQLEQERKENLQGNGSLTDYKKNEVESMIDLVQSDQKGTKGAWEAYKLAKAAESVEYSGDISSEKQTEIKNRAKDFVYVISGYNIYGITERDISQVVKTTAEKFADSYLKMQIEKVTFMNQETASKYVERKPIFGKWTVVDTFVEGVSDFFTGDKNPNDTRWMRKFYYEQIWGQRLNKMLGDDYYGSLTRMDSDSWETLMENNYYNWLNDEAGLESSEALAARDNWNSGQFIVDIAVATGLTIAAVEAAPAALAFGSAVVDWLLIKGSQTTAAITGTFNNGSVLVTNIGVIVNSGTAAQISAQEALYSLQIAAADLSLAVSGNLNAYVNMANSATGSSGGGGSTQGDVPNKDGKKGGKEHQDKIKEIRDTYESYGFDVDVEYRVKTPGGYKDSRFGDLIVKDPNTGESWIVQVGRQTQAGNPVAREVKAIIDLNAKGYYVEFVPYN